MRGIVVEVGRDRRDFRGSLNGGQRGGVDGGERRQVGDWRREIHMAADIECRSGRYYRIGPIETSEPGRAGDLCPMNAIRARRKTRATDVVDAIDDIDVTVESVV